MEKDILLRVTAELGDSTARIAELSNKVAILAAEEKNLKDAVKLNAAEIAEQQKVIEAVTVDYSAGAVSAEQYNAAVASAQAIIDADTEALDEQNRKLAQVSETRKAYAKEIANESKHLQNAIKADGEYTNTLQGMADELAKAKTELRGMNMYLADGKTIDPEWTKKAEEVKKLNDRVKEAEETYGVYSRNVGNYSNSIIDAISGMGGRFTALVKPIRNAKTAMDAFGKAGPVLMLTLLANVISSVVNALKGSEENTNRMTAAFGSFKAIGDLVTIALQGLGKVVAGLAEGFSRLINRLASMVPALAKVNERMKERNELARAEIELNRRQRESSVEVAQMELEVSELRAKATDKETYTAKERVQFLDEAIAKERQIATERRDIAQAEYEQIRRRNAQTESSKEELDEEAQARVRNLEAEKTYNERMRSLTKERNRYIAEERSAARAAQKERDEEAKAREERQKKYAEEAKKESEEIVKTYAEVRKVAYSDTVEYKIQAVVEGYDEALRQVSELEQAGTIAASEAAELRLQIATKQTTEISALRAAEEDKELADMMKMADEEKRLRQQALDDELQEAWKSAEQQYQLRKDYLTRELEAEALTAAERAKIEQELFELEQAHNEQRIAALEDYASKTLDVLGSVNDVVVNVEERRVQQYEADNERQREALDRRLAAGVISQQKYDEKVAALDAELDAQKAAIARRQAAREKALSAMEIAVNTATAIMKIWAEVPKGDFGASTLVLTGLAAAAGAAQLAAVLSEPLPKAAKGGEVHGATHANGGVIVNVEDKERIVAAEPSKAFPELLNLISYIGKHGNVATAGGGGGGSQAETAAAEPRDGGDGTPVRVINVPEIVRVVNEVSGRAAVPDTGFAARMSAAEVREAEAEDRRMRMLQQVTDGQPVIDYDRLAEIVARNTTEAVKGVKVVVYVDDIDKAQEEYESIKKTAVL